MEELPSKKTGESLESLARKMQRLETLIDGRRKNLEHAHEEAQHREALLERFRERIAKEYKLAKNNPDDDEIKMQLSITMQDYTNIMEEAEYIRRAEKYFDAKLQNLGMRLEDAQESFGEQRKN